nr:AAA family ATPase [uncultured Carboxylicivirga sp.]
MENRKELHMLTGAIGTGKSTFAEDLKNKTNMDILSDDKIEENNSELTDNEVEHVIMEDFLDLLSNEKPFILDGLNINASSRNQYIRRVRNKGYKIIAYDFGPGNNISLDRRLNDDRGVPHDRWKQIAESNRNDYESPKVTEGIMLIRKMIN